MAATWNPGQTNARITLSNGNLTALSTTAGVGETTVSNTPITSGQKKYWEITVDALQTSSESAAVGITSSTQGVADNNFISAGGTSNGLGWWNSGNVYFNGTITYSADSFTTLGTVLSFAVDFAANLIWFRVNGQNWNKNASADPATGVGGFSILGITGAGMYPACTFFNGTTAGQLTVNFGATTFARTPPAGFTGFFSTTAVNINLSSAETVVLQRATGKNVQLGLTNTLRLTKQVSHGIGTSVASALMVSRATSKALGAQITSSVSVAKSVTKRISASVASALSTGVARTRGALLSLSTPQSVRLVRSVGKTISLSTASSVNVQRALSKIISVTTPNLMRLLRTFSTTLSIDPQYIIAAVQRLRTATASKRLRSAKM